MGDANDARVLAWLIEYHPSLHMVTFATVIKAQADRIKAERGDKVTVTPLAALTNPEGASRE